MKILTEIGTPRTWVKGLGVCRGKPAREIAPGDRIITPLGGPATVVKLTFVALAPDHDYIIAELLSGGTLRWPYSFKPGEIVATEPIPWKVTRRIPVRAMPIPRTRALVKVYC